MQITWRHTDADLDVKGSIGKKIEIFQAKVWGWQLHVADLAINGGRNHEDAANVSGLPHSGFAVLQILLSYFETIARYESGNTGKDQSREFFIQGVLSVFPQVRTFPYAATRRFLNQLYENARCGLYHISMTRAGVAIARTHAAISFAENPPRIVIDPHELAPALKRHFECYIARLRDPTQAELQENFRKRFNHDHA